MARLRGRRSRAAHGGTTPTPSDAARARGDEEGARKAQAKANKATEELGQQATDAHVREKYPDAKKLHQGEGPNTLDNVYENGSPPPKYIVAESKGGSATNSSSRAGPDGDRYQQGTPEYLDSTTSQMKKSDDPATRETGKKLQQAAPGEVEYIEVKQPIDGSGNPSDIKVSKYGDSVPGTGSQEP